MKALKARSNMTEPGDGKCWTCETKPQSCPKINHSFSDLSSRFFLPSDLAILPLCLRGMLVVVAGVQYSAGRIAHHLAVTKHGTDQELVWKWR
jgi:hypothetical protein